MDFLGFSKRHATVSEVSGHLGAAEGLLRLIKAWKGTSNSIKIFNRKITAQIIAVAEIVDVVSSY